MEGSALMEAPSNASGSVPVELRGLLESYLASTEALQRAQEALRRQVAELGAELEQKNALLARRNRLAELGEMAAGVAHEIRNPLGGIRLYAGLLERDLSADPAQAAQAALVGKIRVGVEQLDRIVREMLAFTKQIVLERRETALERVVDEALGFALPGGGSGIRIQRRYAAGLTASVDLHHLHRAVLNLLLNAVEAMPEGGVLTVSTAALGADAVEIAVEDGGPGIPADVLPRIFDPFFTTKAQGTGLGLAVVQRVAEAHGGSVEASNRHAGGACFRLVLP